METIKSISVETGKESGNIVVNGSEFEEIYLERSRYLLNVDDLLEEFLSENTYADDNAEEIGRSFLESNTVLENIDVDGDIPISVPSEFENIL